MTDSLRLYHSILEHMRRFLPEERITRLRNLALLMSGLFLARSVHLALIARKWPLKANLMSLTNRLRRFLSNARLDPGALYEPVARALIERFREAGTPVYLLLDTTQLGRRHRLFSISIAWKRRALPLCWRVVDKPKGHLSASEQVHLFERLGPLLDDFDEVWVLGDAEFGQVALMRYCRRRGWHFIFRVRGHYSVRPTAARTTSTARTTYRAAACRLCDIPLEEGQTRYLGPVIFTTKHAYEDVEVVLHWGAGEEKPWLLVSSDAVGPATLRRYRRRMWTEELYGDLKGHGFDLEATRLGGVERLERLVLGVLLVFVWLIVLGSRTVRDGKRPLVDRRDRRDRSYFRIGWDYLERCIHLAQPLPVTFTPYRFKVIGS